MRLLTGKTSMTPYEILDLLNEAALIYETGKELLSKGRWLDGANMLLDAIEILGDLLGPSHIRIIFRNSWVDTDEWIRTILEFHRKFIGARSRVQANLGREFDLPFGTEIVCQIAAAKAHILLEKGVKLLQEWSWWSYLYPFKRPQEAIDKLKDATILFRINCPTDSSLLEPNRSFRPLKASSGLAALYLLAADHNWAGNNKLQATARLTAAYLAPVIFILVIGVGLFQTGSYIISNTTPPTPTPVISTPALTTHADITFTIHCFDGTQLNVDDQETIVIPLGDAVIIETNISPRSVDVQIVAPIDSVTAPDGPRQFLYGPEVLGPNIVDFSFFTGQYINKSLFIEVVPKGTGGSCHQ